VSYEHNYIKLLNDVEVTGELVKGRNGDTLSCFGKMLEIRSLEEARFPILTTRKMHVGGILGELAAFVRGATMLSDFKKWGCNYWDANAEAWATNEGREKLHVGKIYGAQWRNFNGVDQLTKLVKGLKEQPTSRRHILTAYNPAELDLGCLPPCHLMVQYSVRRGGVLESCVYMRSVDLCVGLPTDVALYAAMQIVLANELALDPGAITFMLGDAHIYTNHLDALAEQTARTPGELPTYDLLDSPRITEFVPDDLILIDYKPQPRIDYAFNV
jgi:thymidylate synthase